MVAGEYPQRCAWNRGGRRVLQRSDGSGTAVGPLSDSGRLRLPGYGRNAFTGPDYASLDLKLGRLMDLGERFHLELSGDLFNLFSRNNED